MAVCLAERLDGGLLPAGKQRFQMNYDIPLSFCLDIKT